MSRPPSRELALLAAWSISTALSCNNQSPAPLRAAVDGSQSDGLVRTRAAHPADGPVHPLLIENTELRILPRAANHRDYLLYIGLPPSFKEHPERRFPVLYVCDGYWDFNLINALYGNLRYDEVVPEYILVGLGYPDHVTGDEGDPRTRMKPDYERLRRWDLAPTIDEHARNPEEWGHAADFLAVAKKSLSSRSLRTTVARVTVSPGFSMN